MRACTLSIPLYSNILIIMAGWVLGQPETEEAENRIIALKTKDVVVSVDHRKYDSIEPGFR